MPRDVPPAVMAEVVAAQLSVSFSLVKKLEHTVSSDQGTKGLFGNVVLLGRF